MIAELGEPETVEESTDSTIFIYRGEATNVITYVFIPMQYGTFDWWVRIVFDEDGLVQSIQTQRWFRRGEGRDPGVRYKGHVELLPGGPHDREMALREQWHSLCRRSVEGDGAASSALASHFRHGWQPAEKDLIKAYLWYTFAANRGYSSAADYRNDLESEMGSAEILEAKQLVKEWEPDPADCQLRAAQADY